MVLVRDLDAPFGQEFLDVSIAQCEAPVEQNGPVNDVVWKAVAGKAKAGVMPTGYDAGRRQETPNLTSPGGR